MSCDVTRPDGTLDPDKEPWSIIFAKELPVRAKFNDGNVWMAIRADGFTRGEGDEPGKYKPAITELLEIAANYKIEKTDQGATLKRDGDVQVHFPIARPRTDHAARQSDCHVHRAASSAVCSKTNSSARVWSSKANGRKRDACGWRRSKPTGHGSSWGGIWRVGRWLSAE